VERARLAYCPGHLTGGIVPAGTPPTRVGAKMT
jgi:hypothetical protein